MHLSGISQSYGDLVAILKANNLFRILPLIKSYIALYSIKTLLP